MTLPAPLRQRLTRAREAVLALPGARRTVRAVVLLASGFRGEAITLRASALTYLTLFSLVPLLAVVYSVVDLVSGQEQLRSTVQSWINQQLGIGPGAVLASRLDEYITKASVKALGAIGFAALLVSVVSLLWNIESAFNHIYGVRRPRGVVERLLKYWTFLTLGPVFLSASVTLTWKISGLQQVHAAHEHAGHSEALHVLAALSSVAITYAALSLLYKVLPNARVRLRSALIAGFVAGTLWELAKFAFAVASARMVQVHKIYGSLAVLPITLTWIYISWIIALVGCRFCYALDASRKPAPSPLLRGAAAREALTGRILVELARLQRALGRPVRSSRIATELELPRNTVREALQALSGAGIVAEARKGGWLPARDLSLVTLAEVHAASRGTLPFPTSEQLSDPALDALLQSLGRADQAAAAALSEPVSSLVARTSDEGKATDRPSVPTLSALPGARSDR